MSTDVMGQHEGDNALDSRALQGIGEAPSFAVNMERTHVHSKVAEDLGWHEQSQ